MVSIDAMSVPGLERWLAEGGDIHALVNPDGWTLLHLAVESEEAAGVEYLVQQGLDINVQDSRGRTPLHQAVDLEIDGAIQSGRPLDFAFTNKLIELGADLKAVDKSGRTPIDIASAYGPKAKQLFEKLVLNRAS
jgi:uncharacterized protein